MVSHALNNASSLLFITSGSDNDRFSLWLICMLKATPSDHILPSPPSPIRFQTSSYDLTFPSGILKNVFAFYQHLTSLIYLTFCLSSVFFCSNCPLIPSEESGEEEDIHYNTFYVCSQTPPPPKAKWKSRGNSFI